MMDGESQPMSDTMHLVKKCHSTIPSCSEMELDKNESLKISNGTIIPQTREKTPEKGEGSNVVFTKETSLLTNDNIVPRGYGCCCGCSANLGSRDLYTAEELDARKKEKEKDKQERKLCKQDRPPQPSFFVLKCHSTIPSCSEMELDENESLKSSNGTIVPQTPEKGEGSNVVFTKETSLLINDNIVPRGYGCGCGCSAKLGSRDLYTAEESDAWKQEKEKDKQERKLCKQDRVELGRMFQKAMSSQNWDRAESLVMGADLQALNDALCLALDSIWFLTARLELEWVTWMIQKIVSYGANDFTRAALRTSFLASCVSACQNKATSLVDTVSIMDQKLNERLQECNGDEVLKAQAGAKVQKFTEWAMRCIGFHTRCQESRGKGNRSTVLEVQLQLGAFKAFLDVAGDNLTGKDFTEAFDAVCFPLTLFSNSFEPGWSAGLSATSVKGLLEMLVEGGADNVNQCFLEASRFGSTELVRILLQIAHWNSLDVDVDLALGFASHYCKIGTMECLVEEGLAFAFLGPLMRAAERGCLEVVEWFVERGCHDMELCLAVTAATSSSQLATIEYLLPHIPRHVISSLGAEIIKAAGDRSGGPASLDGVAFLLGSDFFGDASATYAVADGVAGSDDEAVAPDLRDFLREHWSASAFSEGMKSGRDHYVNFMRVLKRGDSPVCLRDLPPPLVTAIAYLPLYRECVAAGTPLLSQRLRGRLVDAARRLGDWMEAEYATLGTHELLTLLMRYLPPFLL